MPPSASPSIRARVTRAATAAISAKAAASRASFSRSRWNATGSISVRLRSQPPWRSATCSATAPP